MAVSIRIDHGGLVQAAATLESSGAWGLGSAGSAGSVEPDISRDIAPIEAELERLRGSLVFDTASIMEMVRALALRAQTAEINLVAATFGPEEQNRHE